MALALLLALAGAAVMLSPATQAASPPPSLQGEIELANDLVVGPDDALVVGPGSTIRGPGRIVVHGALTVEGTKEAPVTFRTSLLLEPGSRTTVREATFSPVQASSDATQGGFAIRATSADLVVDASRFEASHARLVWEGSNTNRLRINASAFVGLSGTALNITGSGDAQVFRSTFDRNTVGVAVTPDRHDLRFSLTESRFEANRAHAGFTIFDNTAPLTRLELVSNDFGRIDPAAGNAGRGVLLKSQYAGRTQASGPEAAAVEILSAGNRFHDMPVAVRASGPGFLLKSFGDRFDHNGVAFEAVDARAILTGPLFSGSREYDVHTTGHLADVELVNAQHSEGMMRVAEGNRLTVNGKAIAAAGAAAATAGAISVAFLTFTDAGRHLFARFALLPLYTRLAPSDVLAHEKRKAILDYVAAQPGTHMRRIGHALALSYGTLTYHLYRLEKEGLVTSEDDGLFKRYYVSTGRVKERAHDGPPMITSLRAIERQIFDDITANPGSAQSAIAQRLGLSRQALHYHVKKLERSGIIRKEPQGRETLCYPAVEVDGTLIPAPASAGPEGLAAGEAMDASGSPRVRT